MRPKGSKEDLEVRRREAVALLQQGRGVREVARLVGASPGSVVRWRDAFDRGGEVGLNAKRHPGSRPRLSDEARNVLIRMLRQGARYHGFRTEGWTLARISELIERRFGVKYHPSQVWRILQKMGWNSQPGPAARTEHFRHHSAAVGL